MGMFPVALFAQSSNIVVDPAIETNAVHSFKLLLTFATNIYTDKEPIMYRVGLSNVSDSATLVMPSYFNENFWFYITNGNRVSVPPINEEYSWHGSRGGREVVPPHTAERLFHFVPLDAYFDLVPGTYRIYAVRDFGNPFRGIMYTSQAVTISVVKSDTAFATNNLGPPTK